MPAVFAVGAGLGCFFFIIIYSFIFSYFILKLSVNNQKTENCFNVVALCLFAYINHHFLLVGALDLSALLRQYFSLIGPSPRERESGRKKRNDK